MVTIKDNYACLTYLIDCIQIQYIILIVLLCWFVVLLIEWYNVYKYRPPLCCYVNSRFSIVKHSTYCILYYFTVYTYRLPFWFGSYYVDCVCISCKRLIIWQTPIFLVLLWCWSAVLLQDMNCVRLKSTLCKSMSTNIYMITFLFRRSLISWQL